MSTFNIHSDDYGISNSVSSAILKAINEGEVDSVSLITNMQCYQGCIEKLKPYFEKVKISVHLNIVEGSCCSNKEDISLLVNEEGQFKLTWGRIFLYSIFRRKTLEIQLINEFHKQIEAALAYLPKDYQLRIDSHQHTHMIPHVFRSVLKTIDHYEYNVDYIRITHERFLSFLKVPTLIPTYRIINIIKNRILWIFSIQNKKELLKRNLQYNDFFGVLFTGNMDKNRVQTLLPIYINDSNNKNDIEVVFHIGQMQEQEVTPEYNKKSFLAEHTASARLDEYETIQSVRKNLLSAKGVYNEKTI